MFYQFIYGQLFKVNYVDIYPNKKAKWETVEIKNINYLLDNYSEDCNI